MKKRAKLLCLLLIIASILTGCSMRTVEQMYRLPKRSKDYNNLQSVIDNAMTDLTYCAPIAGENRQTVQLADLDGDDQPEYLLFAKGTQDKPLRILVFKETNDTFLNICTVECNGSVFDQVEYVDMDGKPGTEIVVGRQLNDQVMRSASVYSFADGELVQLVSANYTKFLTTDIDSDGVSELFILRPGQTESDNGVAELYRVKNGVMERSNEVNLSQPIDKLKRIITGKLDGGKAAVYVASAVGDNALLTDVYTLLEDRLANVTLSNESGTNIQTMRNFYVYADDIDNDGVVELPALLIMKPLDGIMSADMHQLIRWYAMKPDGGEVNKMYTYHNFLGGWYMQVDSGWVSRLIVLDFGAYTEFRLWDKKFEKTEKLFTLYSLTGQNREEQSLIEDRFVLHKTESTVYAAQLAEGAQKHGLTQESVIYSFRMIQTDWKTGET